DRLAPGERGAEARASDRRAARRSPAPLRRARDLIRRDVAAAEPVLPGVRRRADDHRVRRLRRVLRGSARVSGVACDAAFQDVSALPARPSAPLAWNAELEVYA